MDVLLEVRDLKKRFGEKVAVDGISFSVKRGDILGLLGPNGAGKTTAIRVMMGILDADSGNVTYVFNGKKTPMDKGRIGYLPEERGLYDDARVLDSLVYLASLKGTPPTSAREAALGWLRRFDLESWSHQKVEKLSKGMQQKVQFIASVLHQPDLLVLDEPFSGLDPLNQDFVKEIIHELREGGTTILLSAHQMSLVEELCDDICLINRGREVLSGNLSQIKDGYQESVVDLRYPKDEDVSFLDGLPGVRVTSRLPGRIWMRYSGPSPRDFLSQVAQRIEIMEISLRKPPLHDIFVETVRERGEDVENLELA